MYDTAASQATLETQGAEGHKCTRTQAPLIQMLNILLNFPGSLSHNPTWQTNEDEWLNVKAGFKCIMWAFIFPMFIYGPCKGSPVSVFKNLLKNESGTFRMTH